MSKLNLVQVPAPDDGDVRAFCAELVPAGRPQIVQSNPFAGAIAAQCYVNVAHVTERLGGESVFGWALWRFPGAFLTAEHHAVWQRPDGVLQCVTPQETGVHELLFLPSGEFPLLRAAVHNRFWPLTDAPFVRQYIAAADVHFRKTRGLLLHEQPPPAELERLRAAMRVWVGRLEGFALARLPRDMPCPCGSGSQVGECHRR